jgi:hypothetical protein
MIEPIGRRVLDTRLRGYDDPLCGKWIASLAMTVKIAPPFLDSEQFATNTPANDWR